MAVVLALVLEALVAAAGADDLLAPPLELIACIMPSMSVSEADEADEEDESPVAPVALSVVVFLLLLLLLLLLPPLGNIVADVRWPVVDLALVAWLVDLLLAAPLNRLMS